jgi:hypothetical protein
MIRAWPIISCEQVGDFRLFPLTKKMVRSPRTGEIREVQALQFSDWVLILARSGVAGFLFFMDEARADQIAKKPCRIKPENDTPWP